MESYVVCLVGYIIHVLGVTTNFTVKFEYFNTSSSVVILNIFKMLSEIDSKVKIEWYYENDDSEMHELGQDYQAMLKDALDFVLIPIDSF